MTALIWASEMISCDKDDSRGSIAGCLTSCVRDEACNRPPTLKIPVVSTKEVSLAKEASNEPFSAMILNSVWNVAY